ncbi:MAG: LuxR C-terminal-related transcriptional regulator, partial [Gammaproteobacteria bacterium]
MRLPEVAEMLGISRNTAAGYIKSVYRKLGVSSRAEAALKAANLGLV